MDLKRQIELEIKRFRENDDRDTLPDMPVDKPLGSYCDHTVLRAYTKKEIIREFCQEAIRYGAASVAVNPSNVRYVKDLLAGTDVSVGAAIGFPLGATTSGIKAVEAKEAVETGANEVDMVIHIGALKDSNYEYVYHDIKGVVDAVKTNGENHLVKVILETCYLTDEQKIAACVISREAGADFVKTSTGMGTGGATIEDVKLMRKIVGDTMRIKAAGDIVSREDVVKMIKAGASRVGVSRLIQIVTNNDHADSASAHNKIF